MKRYIPIVSLIAIIIGAASCKTETKKDSAPTEKTDASSSQMNIPSEEKEMDKADSLVAQTIMAHGGDLYDTAHYGFKFREKDYTFHNKKAGYTYTASGQKDGDEIRDVLINGTLTRTVNGDTVELSPKDIAKYSEALNSVIYFATLPHKLSDPAVNKAYKGRTTIKGQDYQVLAVSFDQEGGGKDHNDEFRYWINADTKTVDYLAYNYETNDGGVRFRSAYDPRTVGGIRFQDYVNYEAPLGTPLAELPGLYEAGKLKEFSRIETEDVVVINSFYKTPE